jgi:hypothetical protein
MITLPQGLGKEMKKQKASHFREASMVGSLNKTLGGYEETLLMATNCTPVVVQFSIAGADYQINDC